MKKYFNLKDHPKIEDIEVKNPFCDQSPEKTISEIMGHVNALYKDIIRLEDRLDPYLQGTRDNETIQKLEEENRELRSKDYYKSEFSFSEEEIAKGQEWCKNHPCRGGASGGNFSWRIIPTGLGVIKDIKCNCGKGFTIQGL